MSATFTDIEAEKAVVGRLCEGHGLDEIIKHAPDIKPEWFAVMGPVWNAACYLDGNGISVDSYTLSTSVEKMGLIKKVGGPEIFVPRNMGFGIAAQSLDKLKKLSHKRVEAKIGSDLEKGNITGADAVEKLLPLIRDNSTPGIVTFTDLGPWLDGTAKQEVPTIAEAFDGKGLFYAGRLNEIHGEPGTGKTNVLMASCIAVLEAGGSVLYIDPEDTPRGFTTRMLMLGASPDDIRDRVNYLHNPSPDEIRGAQLWARENHPEIVVLDGLAESMAAQGMNENEAGEVLAFFRENLRPFAEAGGAVVIADHVTKSSEGRGQFARGSGAKAGRYDGVSYEIVMGKAYTPSIEGFVRLKIQKDRNGGAGPRSKIAAELHLMPGVDGRTIIAFREPEKKLDGPFRPTAIMEKIVRHLETNGEVNKRGLRTCGKAEWVDVAIETLIEEGKISLRKDGGSHLYSLKNDKESE